MATEEAQALVETTVLATMLLETLDGMKSNFGTSAQFIIELRSVSERAHAQLHAGTVTKR